ncbi:MAG: hypothetical protein RL630_1130 [Verrucomicrobiota bacterium]|jgi:molybdopterin-containing oxidoreductase family iron-sulfur binding subunit
MSKRIFNHPEESHTGKRYWRSLGQLQDTPEFRSWLQREFPQGASELGGGEVSRRGFLSLMGASVALAGMSLSACRRPLKNLLPFTKGVEWSVPGKALFFASAMPSRNGAIPLLVTTYDGRPTKIEGNPLHKANQGTTDVWAQSSVLDLYDPERSKSVLCKGTPSDLKAFESDLSKWLAEAGDGASLAFLVDGCVSPTRERLRKAIIEKFPKARWAVYEPNGNALELQAASVAFGQNVVLRPRLERAQIILSIDRDFLGVEGDISLVRGFSSGRRASSPSQKMNRLYVAENRYTLTGGMSDHRLRVPATLAGSLLKAIALEVGRLSGDAGLVEAAKRLPAQDENFKAKWVEECALDLWSNKGSSVVLVGQKQPVAVQALGLALNAVLDSVGSVIEVHSADQEPALSISALADDLKAGKISSLFILGGNPAFNAPGNLSWADIQAGVSNVVHLSAEVNETSVKASWHIPEAHFLEQWSDAVAIDGSYLIVQPVILPIYGGLSSNELLAKVAGKDSDALTLVKETFGEKLPADSNTLELWVQAVRDGICTHSAPKGLQVSLSFDSVAKVCAASRPLRLDSTGFELVFLADSKVDDGRYANNGWLQELPDPVTKLTWDNAALISPASAERLSVVTGDVVAVTVDGRTVELPVLVLPGHAENSISVAVGYGRSAVGSVGLRVGFDVYPVTSDLESRFRKVSSVVKVGRKWPLAVTQEHGALEGRGADITRQATMSEWKDNSSNENFFKKMGIDAHAPQNFSLYTHPPLNDVHAWGMSVDLNSCTGCSACMIACQAENNIPVVGKEQVINGREMHWIRTDRYFASEGGDSAEPEMVSQPMMCQQCENAPCETVCPVNATVHSEDGLNVMAYNRCIGTRYCANNCPFKVRRFNFFDYNQRSIKELYKWNLISKKGTPDSIQLQKNPNVTVRMRGVMEKCTFCVQRVQEAKITAKALAKDSEMIPRVPVDSFTSACAQVCPTGAITFGDLNQQESQISKLRTHQRGYRLLEYLNTENRVWYLARIRNPNFRMPDAQRAGSASREIATHGNSNPHTAGNESKGGH